IPSNSCLINGVLLHRYAVDFPSKLDADLTLNKVKNIGGIMKSFARSLLATATLILAFATVSFSQTSKTAESFPNITIKNFGQMDANYYRGGQPKQNEYQSLKGLGVTTVIDLRNDPESYEKPTVE